MGMLPKVEVKLWGVEGGVFVLAQTMLSMLYLACIHRSLNLGLDQ